MKVNKVSAADRFENKEGITSRLSITAKITTWYTLLLFLGMLILMITVLHFYNVRIKIAAENKLGRVVNEVGALITADGEDFIFDGNISYYYRDTYISVYDMDGEFITGRRPRGIDEFPPLNTEDTQVSEDSSGSEWYSRDKIIEAGSRKLYIRGMLNNVARDGRIGFEIRMFAILLPTLLVLAAFGGYLIARGAFAPIRNIIKTTEDITREGDLSLRIPLGKSRDELYELSEAFNNMFDRVEDVVRREKQFTADVSHELRTPLAVIQAQSEFAMEEENYAGDAARVINSESRRMSSLINNLLMIARSDAGRMIPDNKETDVSTRLEEIVEVLAANASEAGQSIEAEIQDGLTAYTDEDMLTGIIINLMDNAVKYGKGEGGRISLRAYEEDDFIVCRVSNDGEGIQESDRDRIWERFYQADRARSGKGGAGIGLAIVAALTKALGGSVTLLDDEESELGGASFELRIPKGEKK